MSDKEQMQRWDDEWEERREAAAETYAKIEAQARARQEKAMKKIKPRSKADGLVVLIAFLALMFWLKIFQLFVG